MATQIQNRSDILNVCCDEYMHLLWPTDLGRGYETNITARETVIASDDREIIRTSVEVSITFVWKGRLKPLNTAVVVKSFGPD